MSDFGQLMRHFSEERRSYVLQHLPMHLAELKDCERLYSLLTDIFFLEAKTQTVSVFDLAADVKRAVETIPNDHPHHKILRLLEEAIRRDIHFIARHTKDYPQALFQCLWNSCWWYDSPEAEKYYEEPEGGWKESSPWEQTGPKLHDLLEGWHAAKQGTTPSFSWLRSTRPPWLPLRSGQDMVFAGHEDWVQTLDVSCETGLVVSGSTDGTVRVWDLASGAEIRQMQMGLGCVAALSSDGRRIAAGSSEGDLVIVDACAGTELQRTMEQRGGIASLTFSPNSNLLACGYGNRPAGEEGDFSIGIRDSDSFSELCCLRGHEYEVDSLSFSPDGDRLASGSTDGVRIWDILSGEELLRIRPEFPVRDIAFFPDGRKVVCGLGALGITGSPQTLVVFDAETGKRLASASPGSEVLSVVCSPDGRYLVCGADYNVCVIDTTSGDMSYLGPLDYYLQSVAWVDRHRVLSGSSDGMIRLWDLDRTLQPRTLRGHYGHINGLTCSLDGRQIATASSDCSIYIWNSRTGTQEGCWRRDNAPARCVAFSPTGAQVAAGFGGRAANNGQIRIWNAKSAREICLLLTHGPWPYCIAYSPDGKLIGGGFNDGTVRVWDVTTREELRRLHLNTRFVSSLSFSQDGQRLAASGLGTILEWDVATGALLHSIQTRDSYNIPRSLDNLTYCAEDSRIAGSTWFYTEIRDIQTSRVLIRLEGVGEVSALTRKSPRPYQMIRIAGEIAVRDIDASSIIAWLPVRLEHFAALADGASWAGAYGNHLYIVTLEGMQKP